MAVFLGMAPLGTTDAISVAYESMREEKRETRIETRIHQRQCGHCRRWFWAWDPDRFRCFVCDAPPPRELQRILGNIHGTTEQSLAR